MSLTNWFNLMPYLFDGLFDSPAMTKSGRNQFADATLLIKNWNLLREWHQKSFQGENERVRLKGFVSFPNLHPQVSSSYLSCTHLCFIHGELVYILSRLVSWKLLDLVGWDMNKLWWKNKFSANYICRQSVADPTKSTFS